MTDAREQARQQWDVKCALCGKPGHQHNSATRACPIGRKHRTFGYSSFHNTNRFTDALNAGVKASVTMEYVRAYIEERTDWQGREALLADIDGVPVLPGQPKRVGWFVFIDGEWKQSTKYAESALPLYELPDGVSLPAAPHPQIDESKMPPRPIGSNDANTDPDSPLVRYGRASKESGLLLEPMADGYWTPWHIANEMLREAQRNAGAGVLDEPSSKGGDDGR